DRLASDAHNIFVEYLTTTGLLGLGALVVWLVAATRSARGWLLVAALGVFAIHLFEPQSVVTTPLAFLALGASGSFGGTRVKPRRSVIQWLFPVGCVAVAMAAASVFLFGQFQANQAQLDLIAAPAQQADRLLPAWPATASALAQVWLFHGITNGHDQADYERSRSWRVVAVQRDSTDPGLWNDLGELDVSIGRSQDASAEFTTALRLNPTSARAMLGLAQLARGRCDPVQEQYWLQRSSLVTASTTPGPARANPTAPKCAG
ncbi:MAG: hypothetical protein M3N98_04030, partial [Actinomycetota bacterium]|nr:hypothetical protein [Actinomycetota bacterium]